MTQRNWVKIGATEEAQDLALILKSGDEGASFALTQVAPDEREWLFDQVCGLMVRFSAIRADNAARNTAELESLL